MVAGETVSSFPFQLLPIHSAPLLMLIVDPVGDLQRNQVQDLSILSAVFSSRSVS